MGRQRGTVQRIAGTLAVAAAAIGAVHLLPPLLREIFTVLLQAWVVAILAYVAFVALLLRRH